MAVVQRIGLIRQTKPNKALPPKYLITLRKLGDKSVLENQLQETLGKKRNSGGLRVEHPFEEVLLAF